MSQALQISHEDDLKILLERLVRDLIDAGAFVRLHKHFDQAFDEYQEEVRQTPVFWNLTESAIRESSLIRLARIYDQDHRSVSLLTILHTIGRHAEFFNDDSVLKRVSEAYKEKFRPGSHQIDEAQLREDIRLVSASEPLVNKLIVWRSNQGAHTSAKPLLRRQENLDPLTRDDVFELVDRAFTIFNRYLTALEGASYSRIVIGENAHSFLFEMLRLGLQKFNEDIERQWAQRTNSEQGGTDQPATAPQSKPTDDSTTNPDSKHRRRY